MAAVITMTNLEMLRMGDRSKGQAGSDLFSFAMKQSSLLKNLLNFS